MQEAPAPPQSQIRGVCRGWPALDLRGRSLVSPDLDSGSLELADCMVDPRKTYGEMAGLWGSAKTYGEMRQACGRMGKPQYRMGRRPMCGEAAESHGERKSHEKPEYGSGRRRLGMGAAGPAWGVCPNGRLGAICGLCIFLQQPGAPPGHGRRRTGRRCYLYTVQSSGVFIVFIPEKTQKSRRLNSVIQVMRWQPDRFVRLTRIGSTWNVLASPLSRGKHTALRATEIGLCTALGQGRRRLPSGSSCTRSKCLHYPDLKRL